MQIVDRIYCDSCGYEDFDVSVAYSRQTANSELYTCPECGKETSHVDVEHDE